MTQYYRRDCPKCGNMMDSLVMLPTDEYLIANCPVCNPKTTPPPIGRGGPNTILESPQQTEIEPDRYPNRTPSRSSCVREETKIALADIDFEEWWADVGVLASQRISVCIGSETPQDFIKAIYKDAWLMSYNGR